MRRTLKRLLPIIVALMFILSSIPVGAVDTQDSVTFYKIGDANADKKIDINDVTKIQKALAEIIPADVGISLGGDVNGDGEIDIHDVTEIQKAGLFMAHKPYPYDKFPSYKIQWDSITISEDSVINSQEVYAEDQMQPDVLTMRGSAKSFVSIIRTKEELASLTACYSPELDDEFFKENSLLVGFIDSNSGPTMYDSYTFENIHVEGNTLKVGVGICKREGFSPVVDGIVFYFPKWYIMNKVSKEDVSAVDNIVCSFKYSVE